MKNNIITLLLAQVVLFACEKSSLEQAQPETQPAIESIVSLTPAQVKNADIQLGKPDMKALHSTVRLNGVIDVAPGSHISISNPFGGFIKSINLLPGMRVKPGDVVVTLEDPQYIEIQQDYLMAVSKLTFLEADFRRQQELNADKTISDKVFQQVSSDYAGQKVLIKALYEKLRLLNIQPETLTENTLSRTIRMTSPVQGYVSAIHVNQGKYVSATDVMLELVDERNLHVSLTVFEKDLPFVRPGQSLSLTCPSLPGKQYQAKVHAINNTVTDDRSSEVHADLTKDHAGLLPGMFVTAELSIEDGDVAAVPEDAVVTWENKQYIFSEVSANTFEMTRVETGMASSGYIQIKNKLANKNIVTAHAYSLLMKLKGGEE